MAPPSPWSDIPLELAGLVLRRLPAHVDRARFAAVCPQWRAAAREVSLPSPLPLLALPDGTVYSLPGSEPLRFAGCTGYADACGNWLAFSTEDGSFLKDPFSNATVTLPQLSRVRAPCHCGERLISWIEIEEPPEKLTMYKPVFCSGQLIATFIRFQSSNKVAVCQLGAASWWSVHVDHPVELCDDMAFHQGKLYVLNGDDHSLLAMDISVDPRMGHPWICQVRRVIGSVPIPFPAIRGINRYEHQEMLYLVESESHGTLMMVHRKTYGEGRTGPRWLVAGTFIPSGIFEFEVFIADFQQSKWTKVTTIGDDQVLFLRRRCSRFIRVSPEEMPGDRIVFLVKDDEDHDWYEHGSPTPDACKVYDMRDGTVSPFVPSLHWERRSVPATWLFPQDNPDARGLYGISFPHFDTLAAIYGKDIATGEGAEGLGEAISNMEKETALEDNPNVAVEEDRLSGQTPRCSSDRNSVDSTSSTSKRRRRDKDSFKGSEGSMSSDPFLGIVGELRGDLKTILEHFGKMAAAMEREAKIQEEAVQKDPMQALQEKSIAELSRLGFAGTELVKAASVFVNIPNQMTMLFALPETLRREFILKMLDDDVERRK